MRALDPILLFGGIGLRVFLIAILTGMPGEWDAALSDPAHGRSSLFVRYGHGPGRPRPLGGVGQTRRGDSDGPAADRSGARLQPVGLLRHGRRRPRGQAFSQAMGGITGRLMLEAARLIDTGSVEFALDVGGASGALIHALMKQNPALRGAVLDLPENSAEAAKAAEALGLQERLSIISGDFFAKVPAADLYLLKHILHDWKDDECVSILRNCRGAIKPNGRVVLIEIVLPDVDPPPYATQVDLRCWQCLDPGSARSRSTRSCLRRRTSVLPA
jgi:hypothetical protein